MNAGFSNLSTLKTHLLGEALRSSTEFNDVILALGLGVAAAFENHCNRKFARTAADTEILAADRIHFLLPRYPVEAVTKIELKTSEAGGWEEQTINDFVKTIDLKSGIIYLPDGADPGDYSSQVRFTYTGGYFWNILEPNDQGYPTALPAGATAVPEDLKLAWLMQCRQAWQVVDKLGTDVATTGSSSEFVTGTLSTLDLIPAVKNSLRKFIREEWV